MRRRVIRLFPSTAHRNAVYGAMLDAIDCGPFDGGCVSFALALQRVLGGEVRVITGDLQWAPDRPWVKGAQHAVLQLPDGRLLDARGADEPNAVIGRFQREEITPPAFMCFTGLRSLREDDLPDAPRDEALIAHLDTLFAHLRDPAPLPPQPWLDERTAPNGRCVRHNFIDWFEDSKVVGDNGDPLVAYRGTTRDENTPDTPAYFASHPRETEGYARGDGGHVMPVYLKIERPMEMDGEAYWKVIRKGEAAEKKLAAQARKKGHDGIIVRGMQDTGAEFTMFITVQGPEQVKSAIGNSGDYDRRNPRITDTAPDLQPKLSRGLQP